MEKILEFNYDKIVDCSSSVAFWNYWDHEHLEVVHGGYDNFKILYEEKDLVFSVRDVNLPIVGLKVTTPMFMKQLTKNQLVACATQFGVLSKTTVSINDLEKDKCEINVNYKFYLKGWRKILQPILKLLVPIWFNKVWLEDLPLKKRRQKVLRYGFKDFVGLPKNIEDRKNEDVFDLKLPIPRPKNSIPPLIKKNEKYKQ